jgi:hypothetical protein
VVNSWWVVGNGIWNLEFGIWNLEFGITKDFAVKIKI